MEEEEEAPALFSVIIVAWWFLEIKQNESPAGFLPLTPCLPESYEPGEHILHAKES